MILANGKEIIEYKNSILLKLISNKDICQLILNREITNMDDADMQNEVQENLYDFLYLPSVQKSEGTFVTFDISGDASGQGNIHKTTILMIYALSHHNLMRIPPLFSGVVPQEYKRGNRVDHLNCTIQSIFNGNYDFGIGKMKLAKDNPIQVNDVYYGRSLSFRVSDFSSNG